jgi:hypothetical protein
MNYIKEVKVKFYIHTRHHRRIKGKLDDMECNIEYEKTDLGYKGCISGEDITNETVLDMCDSISKYMISLLLVYLKDNGKANGVGYKYENSERIRERESKDNHPVNWHGIVYNGMHLDADDFMDRI